MAPTMPCKTSKKSKHASDLRRKTNEIKSKLACILEASESTRLRMEESPPNYHEDHIAGKGDNSLQHYNLVHKFIPMPQVMKIPAAKAVVDKEWEKLEKISAWNLTKVRSKKEVIDEERTSDAKDHFASLMDICHLKNAELEAKHQKFKGRVVLETILWKMILDLMQYSLNKDHQHLKWRQQKSWIAYQDCQGAHDKQLLQYLLISKVKMKDAPKLLKILKSECPDIWIRPPRHKWPKSWSSMEKKSGRSSWAKCVRSSFSRTAMRKDYLRKSHWNTIGRKFPNENASWYTVKKGLFLSVYVDDIKLAGKKQNLDPMWKVLNKEVDLGEPTSFLDHVYLGCTQRQCEISKDINDNYRTTFEWRISSGATEKLPCSEGRVLLRPISTSANVLVLLRPVVLRPSST